MFVEEKEIFFSTRVFSVYEEWAVWSEARITCTKSAAVSFVYAVAPLSSGQYRLVLRTTTLPLPNKTMHGTPSADISLSLLGVCMPEISRYNLLLLPATSRRWNIHASRLTLPPLWLRAARHTRVNRYWSFAEIEKHVPLFLFPRKVRTRLYRGKEGGRGNER